MISSNGRVTHPIPLLTAGMRKCACFAAQSAEDDPLWRRLFPLGPQRLEGILQPQPGRSDPHSSKHKQTRHMARPLRRPYKEPYTASTDVMLGDPRDSECTDDFLACEDISLMYVFKLACCFSVCGRTFYEPKVDALKSRCRIIFAKWIFEDAFECW